LESLRKDCLNNSTQKKKNALLPEIESLLAVGKEVEEASPSLDLGITPKRKTKKRPLTPPNEEIEEFPEDSQLNAQKLVQPPKILGSQCRCADVLDFLVEMEEKRKAGHLEILQMLKSLKKEKGITEEVQKRIHDALRKTIKKGMRDLKFYSEVEGGRDKIVALVTRELADDSIDVGKLLSDGEVKSAFRSARSKILQNWRRQLFKCLPEVQQELFPSYTSRNDERQITAWKNHLLQKGVTERDLLEKFFREAKIESESEKAFGSLLVASFFLGKYPSNEQNESNYMSLLSEEDE